MKRIVAWICGLVILCEGSANEEIPWYQGTPLYEREKAGYNLPGAIAPFPENQVHYAFQGSFIYWQVIEEGLGIATNSVLASQVNYLTTDIHPLLQPFVYAPGFQAGFSFVIEQSWELALKYTWIRSTSSQNQGPPDSSALSSTLGS